MVSTTSQIILLVDGYNIIGAWNSLKKMRDKNGLEYARQSLLDTLVNYTGYKALETKVVFDAHYQKTPSYKDKYSDRLWVHYTSYNETADTYIEKYCASFQRKNPDTSTRIVVATSDQAQRHTVVGYGAEWMSAQVLAKEIDMTQKREKRNHRSRNKPQGRFLFNSLDSKTQKALTQMRFGTHR
ncbi:NYN domain-containing protein [Cyanobacterium sp. IPPAS B-1200]|uniref:NYN domain-containing protein n=1 Tax=Cyanobacterium sp. IPPAS B-1200 TaxID=1562720 RepID=UPI00085262EF|nr:NYN domain-containing protein [Cyanobacterium sp. IPPAS B-1200]OEJ79110.1 RNA-binding protein [Cyanobacterium sp. IPPAS B-1200]